MSDGDDERVDRESADQDLERSAVPGEPDPEADLSDPETELPSVPTVEVPTPDEGAASPELLRDFWSTVLVFNVALLATSVGAMMLAFDVERPLGLALFVVGVLSGARGYRKYRQMKADGVGKGD